VSLSAGLQKSLLMQYAFVTRSLNANYGHMRMLVVEDLTVRLGYRCSFAILNMDVPRVHQDLQ